MKPTVRDPLIETSAPVMAPVEPPKKKAPKPPVQTQPPVAYAPPPPDPLPPARRNNSPFYNYKPEPIFPPLVPVTADDYKYTYDETNSYYGGPFKKQTTQPLIPATYPVPRYDLQQYQSIPPPKIWTLPEDPYLFKASGVPAYSAVGSILRSSDVYSFYY
ncbi:uncharacterized protein LOC131956701 [Physella acuta]|uniref:uncharacterized protein LOC131956701 n=1 Tax=Physella acuta TaxID=109671 RepID=UPI0027DAC642|nr:uncharacterized protein LOC131956701 [Physella acuta]